MTAVDLLLAARAAIEDGKAGLLGLLPPGPSEIEAAAIAALREACHVRGRPAWLSTKEKVALINAALAPATERIALIDAAIATLGGVP